MERKHFGPYELLGRLSVGGMAEVHRALDTRTGRVVALKTILPAIAEDEDFVQMFLDEARIASELEHPHIARLLDFGELDDDGQYFIAYELVDGRDLRFIFENASLGGERFPLSILLYVFTRIAEALSYAHARKDRQHFPKAIVHRDVSPQNIVVSYAGDVKLIDFGIAKARGRLTRTGAGTIKGKFGYMSPEQVRGEPVDQTTDVFSLGICMWELLTLKRLFTGPNEILVLDMVKRHIPDPPSAFNAELANLVPEGRSSELDQIVMKSLAKSPDERYKSARELYKELYAFVEKTELMASRDDVARTMRQAFGVSPGDLSGQNPGLGGLAIESRSSQQGSNSESKRGPRTPYSRSTGRIMELQETRMSDDKKGGSDLDIFEGLGKKTLSEKPADSSKAPPPPPGSASHLAAAQKAGLDAKKTLMGIADPANAPNMGVPPAPPTNPSLPSNVNQGPSSSRPQAPGGHASGQMRAAPVSTPSPSKPPPPPGRGSLPNMASPVAQTISEPPRSQPPPLPPEASVARASNPPATSPSATQRVSSNVPPPASTRPGPAGLNTRTSQSAPTQEVAAPATKPNGGKLDMDWDDDDEATHVFDKEAERARDQEKAAAEAQSSETLRGPESREPERASMDAIMSSPPPKIASAPPAAGTPPPPPVGSSTATLSGAFGALGQKANGSAPPSASFKSGPPPSQSLRAAPPPPPGSMKNPSTTTAPIPPPPPPGQTTTAPMHMPPSAHMQQRPASVPPQGHPSGHPSGHHSVPPHPSHHPQAHSQPPVQMPPVSRAMEATAMVPRPQPASKAPLIIGLLLAVMALAGIGVFFVMPKFTPSTVVINVTDSKGGAPKNLEVLVDGAKKCDSSPCVVPNVTPGVHEVKVVAQGYDPQVRALNLEGKNVQSDFTLVGGKTGGTGFKVSGNQAGVKVSVDNKEIGTLPQEVKDLEPGEHKLRFVGSNDRYAPLDKTISVAKDEIVDLGNVNLKVVKGKATILLGTPGAKVYLVQGTNRKEVPQFPMAIEFDPNEKWELQGTKEGFDEFKQPISFEDGQAEKTFTVTLSPKGTAAAAQPPVVAQPPIAHNTPAVHTQPKVAPEPKEAPAPKEPVAKAEPKEPAAKTEPAAKKEPAPAAAGGEAFLNINSLPASTVVLDGKPLGPTPRVKVSVTPGQHTILFVNAEQSLKKTITVSVGAGETKAAFAKLRD